MSTLSDELDNTSISNVSHRAPVEFTTMPSHINVRNPMGRNYPPYPRPTVSMDPRPVVIPILSSVIGFPILVFALICALRHRAMKLRRRDQLKKIQAGVRSVTLDLPPRDKISFFSAGSSPEISIREVGERPDCSSLNLKPSLAASASASNRGGGTPHRNNNRVKFITPPDSLMLDSPRRRSMTVDVVLHTLATGAAAAGLNGRPSWRFPPDSSPPATIENGVELDDSSDYSQNDDGSGWRREVRTLSAQRGWL